MRNYELLKSFPVIRRAGCPRHRRGSWSWCLCLPLLLPTLVESGLQDSDILVLPLGATLNLQLGECGHADGPRRSPPPAKGCAAVQITAALDKGVARLQFGARVGDPTADGAGSPLAPGRPMAPAGAPSLTATDTFWRANMGGFPATVMRHVGSSL